MKKIMLLAIAVGAFTFTSCSKDDGGGSDDSCQTCEMSAGGMTMSNDYCNNGDGTYTVTDEEGNESTQDLPEGVSFNDMISAMEQAGMNCN